VKGESVGPRRHDGVVTELKKIDLLNIKLGKLRHDIASYSSGLAAVCHQLGLNICFTAGVYETCKDVTVIQTAQLRQALERYLADASDTLKAVFELAMKQQRMRSFDNSRLILRAMARLGDAGGTHAEILKTVREAEPKYPASNLTAYLAALQSSKRGEILRYSPASGKYFFSDPLYLAYSQCLLLPLKASDSAWIRLMDFDFAVTDSMRSVFTIELKHHQVAPLVSVESTEDVVDAESVDVDDNKS
jgi:hypothetical protein